MTKVVYIADRFGETINWSIERYHAMIEAGILGEDDRFELLAGKIVPMSPIGRFHAACVSKLAEFFVTRLRGDFSCRQKQPITLPESISEPEPDYVVATRKEDFYASGHPGPEDIHLVLEVSDHTLAKDKTAKGALYALANIPEFWIINLLDRQVEVYTQPEEDGYQVRTVHGEGTFFDHDILGEIEVNAILP